MPNKKKSKRSNYKRLRILNLGGETQPNEYYQNLYETDSRYQLPNVGISENFGSENFEGLGNNNTSNIGDTGNSFNVGKAIGYAGAATSLVAGLNDGDLSKQEAQLTVDSLGSAIGGPYYAGGKAVDQTLFGKDEQGIYDSEIQASLSHGITDPSQIAAQAGESFKSGNVEKGLQEILLPGLSGINAQREAKEAAARDKIKRRRIERTGESLEIAQERGANLGANPNIQTGIAGYSGDDNGTLQDFFGLEDGGYLPSKADGGLIDDPTKSRTKGVPLGKDAKGNIIYSINPVDTSATASYTPNELRPRSKINTINTLIDNFGFNREEAKSRYSPELLDSIANTSDQYQFGTSSVGQPVLNEFIPNRNKTINFENGGGINKNKNILKYDGQTHSNGNEGGIPVDELGVPTIQSKKQAVALTEDQEVNYRGYIFSNKF